MTLVTVLNAMMLGLTTLMVAVAVYWIAQAVWEFRGALGGGLRRAGYVVGAAVALFSSLYAIGWVTARLLGVDLAR